jgi:DNA polymerase III epsilon subunit-like protein
MKYLFFDTETTGLPKKWNAQASDVDNWPRLVQIAWTFQDYDNYILKKGTDCESFIIKPDGFEIPVEASEIHGITQERAMDEGVPILNILERFLILNKRASRFVGHNINFDVSIVGAEMFRADLNGRFIFLKQICTMKTSTNYCRLPGKYGYKFPTLGELYLKLFKKELKDAHDALVDINATAKCFWELKELGVIVSES